MCQKPFDPGWIGLPHFDKCLPHILEVGEAQVADQFLLGGSHHAGLSLGKALRPIAHDDTVQKLNESGHGCLDHKIGFGLEVLADCHS